MKKFGAALVLAAVIAGAGVAAPASASAATPAFESTGKIVPFGHNWPH